jgi:hypothetical protein
MWYLMPSHNQIGELTKSSQAPGGDRGPPWPPGLDLTSTISTPAVIPFLASYFSASSASNRG